MISDDFSDKVENMSTNFGVHDVLVMLVNEDLTKNAQAFELCNIWLLSYYANNVWK